VSFGYLYVHPPTGDNTGREVLEGITEQMPDINVVQWDHTEAKTKPRRCNHEEALVRYAGVMREGRKSASDIRSDLGISSTTWERLTSAMRDQNSALAQRLVTEGVTYRSIS
jgi:hypothetical protein